MPPIISDNDILNMTCPTGRTFKQEMKYSARRLKRCIQQRLEESYLAVPKKYSRTGALLDSLNVDDHVSVTSDGKSISIDLFFDDRRMHTPVMSRYNSHKVNAMKLLNYGFRHNFYLSPVRLIKYFGWRPGSHFIEEGIEDFNATNTLGMTIDYSGIDRNRYNYFT